MCGIAGILNPSSAPVDDGQITRLTKQLAHRGPDGWAVWHGEGVAFGHTRLSIIDTSPAGAQPMTSRCGRFTVAFNGEIYNHHTLRAELDGPFRGHSDTETLVEYIAAKGMKATLAAASGMFALAVFDDEQRTLTLARDRMGEKPLYYGLIKGQLRFGSELKALVLPHERPEMDLGALGLFFRHNYIPTPHTIYRGIHKLRPGHFIVLRQPSDSKLAPEAYWTIDEQLEQPTFEGPASDATDALQQLLLEAVGSQMESDVPLGAFLSGGIDSSLIVALMQAQSSTPVRTFTIGFDHKDYDEAPAAEAIAAHLGTQHTTMRVTSDDALATVDQLAGIWDEPFSDSSQIPTLLLSQLTQKHVTVSLSGDAGDELFAGYTRYAHFRRLHRTAGKVPAPLGSLASRVATAISPQAWDRLARPLALHPPWSRAFSGDRVHKLASILRAQGVDDVYREMVSHWKDPASLLLGNPESSSALTSRKQMGPQGIPARLQYLDQHSYLPDDILVKVDRAAMSASLETRVPLLDPKVVAFAWSLPTEMLERDGQTKWILREVLRRYVPKRLFDRPKKGFGVPLRAWLRGPLRPWAEDLLSERRLKDHGILDTVLIRRRWEEHIQGARNWEYLLWDVLMFQAWHARWRA